VEIEEPIMPDWVFTVQFRKCTQQLHFLFDNSQRQFVLLDSQITEE
jgi:hypothetical protein